ncbi:MAG: ATP phosphoribosyltransferase regulatory subunit [Clostridia bacterium]|nr:ATP phosphoribosyltransferase regulatory subunit [Clostridia bacterium]
MKNAPEPAAYEERVGSRLRQLYASYGYAPFKVCKFEPYDFYSANKSFITGDHILTFTDINGKLMALKPDVTLSIVKNYTAGQKKVYYHENVYRESRNAGEFGEIPQAGIECIGTVDKVQQAEVLSMATQSLAIISDRWILNIASMKLIGALVSVTRADTDKVKALLSCLRKKNRHEIRELTADEDKPVSLAWETLASFYGPFERIGELKGISLNAGMLEACDEMSALAEGFSKEEFSHIRIDFSIISDEAYYNGLVFKGYVEGVHTAILSGGRYDRLAGHLGKQAQAVGFAVYLDMLNSLSARDPAISPDVLVLYGNDVPLSRVAEEAGLLRSEGRRVLCLPKSAPPDGAYADIVEL